ncbi:hypothetical protein HELRODRAFT_69342 [Helobdella robusta]|uniref:Protein-serine/threonine kinase n=1 Tax=Helobdella robusta TaxID=6412 RepID=T1FZT5_HELRO|nr:hypothetical protein HELRODRAFT_69342 [Helobdella robusta]ESN92586.1 hypothetical protein HELRODRAFT_69342 [Helobdella robusta]
MKFTLQLYRGAGKAIDYYGRYHPSVLSIQQFIDFSKKTNSSKQSFLFLRKEIPVRLANIMKEIQLLPDKLLEMPSVKIVKGWYEQSFEDILEFENADPNNTATLQKFLESLNNIRNRHLTVFEKMAAGMVEMKDYLHVEDLSNLDERIHYFLDRFYLSRISIRLIIHQHLLLFGKSDSINSSSLIGCFDPDCDVQAVAYDAYRNARSLCEQYYKVAPECMFNIQKRLDKISMTYVPVHLYYILFELFKNSLRAVVEFDKNNNSSNHSSGLPPLDVLICKGREDITIRLADHGGGIPRKDLDKIFNYLYTSAKLPSDFSAKSNPPLAGYGYGLPISRLYAKYFNGDLIINSVDGFGTDALLYLKVLPKEASELLPVYNKTSSLKYTDSIQVKDWSEPFKTVN